MPRVVLAAPVYNQARYLPGALDSLLGQSDGNLAVVVLDDASTDETAEVARVYAARDARVTYERNAQRLGLPRSWQRALELARARHPDAPYFAWASDHDLWDPRWLERLAAELDDHPEAVLAYPLVERIDERGDSARPAPPWRFDTAGEPDPRRRFTRFGREGRAGDMVYGLFRAAALEPLGFPLALMPDRLLMAELSLAGEFRQVPEVLWRRRHVRAVSARRQRAAFFPGAVPLWSRVPWPLEHAAVLARQLVLDADASPAIGRAGGLWLAAAYLASATWREARKRLLRPVAVLRLGERPVMGAAIQAARRRAGRARPR